MIKNILSIRGEKVVHQQTGECLALLNWPIIDPDTGVIEAFWVKPIGLGLSDGVILVSDILAFKKSVYIRSEKVICDPADVIKITSILDEGRHFLFAQVQNEAGKKYGRIYNLSFSTDTYVIRQLHCKRFLLGLIAFDKRIFPYEKVLKVLPNAVVIDDDATKKEKDVAGAPIEPAL